MVICHRPPGNPNNSKSKVLPLSAILAHLDHGHGRSGISDTLGYCNDEPTGDEPTGDEPGGDIGIGTSEPGSDLDNELPVYCQENIEIDSDCDGVADDSGESIY